jgi:hypothetical protein
MKTPILRDVLGGFDIFSVALDVALVMALFPVIKSFVSAGQDNMTATETLISGLITLVLILALVYSVAHQSGILKGRK